MKKKNVIILGAIIVVIAILSLMTGPKQEVSKYDPVDIVFDFYSSWLEAKQSETTNPYSENLLKDPLLGKELLLKLEEAQKDIENKTDPVLCQETSDIKLSTRIISTGEEKTQILVMARDKTLTGQSVVTLNKINDGWYIYDIECFPGEFDVDREFTFEQEGSLLKQSVPTPLNPENWHIVFNQFEQDGHLAPLLFDSESICIDIEGEESVCDSDQFNEGEKVSVKAQMTEGGAEVSRMEFLKK